jgi:hypothetical protein
MKRGKKLNKILVCLAITGSLVGFSGCAYTTSSSESASLKETYLSEVNNADSSKFANDQAALSYLKQFCEIRLTGGVSRMDLFETIASKYCATDLAKELGVKTAPSPKPGFDEKAFIKEAKRIDPELFEVLEDGSFIEPVALGNQICSQSASELETMKANLAGFWPNSFNRFAVETLCPEKMP